MRLLFPSDPLDKAAADDVYGEELDAARSLGLPCSLFSFEGFEAGEFRPRPAFQAGEEVIYRGWMLKPEGYSRLHASILERGGTPKTSPAQYRCCHYLPEWYPLCEDFTPATVVLARDADFATALADKPWSAYFVKDYVKSLTTQRGSIARNPEEIAEIVSLIELYRGEVEGGVCVRELEPLLPETEERYFVTNRRAHGREGAVPEIVAEIARRIDSPFFSVDIVKSEDGRPRLIELGDGQVSDRKKWPAERLMAMLHEF